jgi:hypothetical protein
MKLLSKQLSLISCNFIPLQSKYFFSTLFSDTIILSSLILILERIVALKYQIYSIYLEFKVREGKNICTSIELIIYICILQIYSQFPLP